MTSELIINAMKCSWHATEETKYLMRKRVNI